jgi:hypothetical protein
MQRVRSRYHREATSDPLAVVTPAQTFSGGGGGEWSNGTVGSMLSYFVRRSRMLGTYCRMLQQFPITYNGFKVISPGRARPTRDVFPCFQCRAGFVAADSDT